MPRARATTPAGAVELATDVGPLLFAVSDQVMRPYIARVGDWELDEATLFRAFLRRGSSVVDVGAHVGYYTVLAARAVGRRGRVLALEPHPANAELLRANVARQRCRNVRVVEAAAWRESARLLLEPGRDANTADNRIVCAPAGADALEVDGIALDELGLGAVDAVKVDAQGTDHVALAGMTRTLERCRPVVFAEFWPAGIRAFGDEPGDVIGFYRSLGFRLTMPGVQVDFEQLPASGFVEVAEQLPGGFGTIVLRPRTLSRG